MPRAKKVLTIEEMVSKAREMIDKIAEQAQQWRYVRESAAMGRVNMPGEGTMNKPAKKKVVKESHFHAFGHTPEPANLPDGDKGDGVKS